jgi:hypothetical protein
MLENLLIFVLGALVASWCFCFFFASEFAKISREWGKIRDAWLDVAQAAKEIK